MTSFAAIALLLAGDARGQSAAVKTEGKASTALAAGIEAPDPILDAAENLIGKALFLRGFYTAGELAYDGNGRPKGTPRVGDWTVAAMNVTRVSRRAPGLVELEGVRAAVRWNPEQQQFERHPLNDDKIKMDVDATEEAGFRKAVAAIFAVGLDPALQRAMPDFWLHYFQPATAWPQDSLTGQTIYPLFGQADQPKDVSPPRPQKQVDAKYTTFAERDKVKGVVQVRLVVDAGGGVQRVVVSRPLGYGLDARTVEAVRQWRFTPAMKDGKAVPAAIVVGQEFVLVPTPRM